MKTVFSNRRLLLMVLMMGLMIRLIPIASAETDINQLGGGDSHWYLANGYAVWDGAVRGNAFGIAYDISVMPTAPLYLYFVGFWMHLFSVETALVWIRVVQALLGTLTIMLAYGLADQMSADKRVALMSAAFFAFSPTLIMEPVRILTETLYIFFILGGIWLFGRSQQTVDMSGWKSLLFAGAVLGLGTLTRAVSLFYAPGLFLLLFIPMMRQHLRQTALYGILFVAVYSGVVGIWTVHNWIAYDRFVVGSNQFMPILWRGAVEGDHSPEESDRILEGSTHAEQVSAVITSDPAGFVQRRIQELGQAYIQPYGTAEFGTSGLKMLVKEWLSNPLDAQKLWAILSSEGFLPRLLIYIWHYGGLLLGAVGMWRTRRNGKVVWALLAWVFYVTVLHLGVLATPRYIFPALVVYWIFAAHVVVAAYDAFYGNQLGEARRPPLNA